MEKMLFNMGFGTVRVLSGKDFHEIAKKAVTFVHRDIPYPIRVESTPSEVAKDLERNGIALVHWVDVEADKSETGVISPIGEPERGPEMTVQGFDESQGW